MTVPLRLIMVLPEERYALAAMFWSSRLAGGMRSSVDGLTSVPWMSGSAVQLPFTHAGEPLISIRSAVVSPNWVSPQTLMLSFVWNGPRTSSSSSNWISVQYDVRCERYLAQLASAVSGSE